MDIEYFAGEAFDVPDEITLNADGTADLQVPEGTEFDSATNSLTFASGEVHMNEIPQGVDSVLNDDGTITVTLSEGMEFNAETGSLHISNELLNQFAPEPLEFTTDGQVVIHLPEDTLYFADGSFVISADSADFMDEGNAGEGPNAEGTVTSAA